MTFVLCQPSTKWSADEGGERRHHGADCEGVVAAGQQGPAEQRVPEPRPADRGGQDETREQRRVLDSCYDATTSLSIAIIRLYTSIR